MEEDFVDAMRSLNKKTEAYGKVLVSRYSVTFTGYSVTFTITGPSEESIDAYVTRLKSLWKNIGYDVESTLDFGYIYALS